MLTPVGSPSQRTAGGFLDKTATRIAIVIVAIVGIALLLVVLIGICCNSKKNTGKEKCSSENKSTARCLKPSVKTAADKAIVAGSTLSTRSSSPVVFPSLLATHVTSNALTQPNLRN